MLRIDPPHRPELLDQYLDTGTGKRSALADLRDPGTQATVRELAGRADVVLSGYRPAALARFGLDAATLRETYPHLAVVELSAWGPDGPWQDRRGFDSLVQAASGIAETYRVDPDPAPPAAAQVPEPRLTTLESAYGLLTVVEPIAGRVRAPGAYGTAELAFS